MAYLREEKQKIEIDYPNREGLGCNSRSSKNYRMDIGGKER